MVILSFLFQKEALISLTHLLLCQQSTVYDQRYKNVGKLNKRFIINTQTTTLQNMCSSYHSIWVSAMILQGSATLSTSQRVKENAEKNSIMNHRSVLHLYHRKLRLLLASSLYIFILTKLLVDTISI